MFVFLYYYGHLHSRLVHISKFLNASNAYMLSKALYAISIRIYNFAYRNNVSIANATFTI